MTRRWWFRQLHIILPTAYVLVGFFLALSGAGHGPGIELAWKLGLPATLLYLLTGGNPVIFVLFGAAQYVLLGSLIQAAASVMGRRTETSKRETESGRGVDHADKDRKHTHE
jgi:hypothetical protein